MVRNVILLTGPPCAGKSTYAQRFPNHEVVDYDAIVGRHSATYQADADLEVERRIDAIAAQPNALAVVIRSVPRPNDRAALAQRLNADQTIVLLPPERVCKARASRRPSGTSRVIGLWYWNYKPAPCDTVLRQW